MKWTEETAPGDIVYTVVSGGNSTWTKGSSSVVTIVVKYSNEGFWAEHPVIRFDTVYEQREYIVMAAFLSRIYGKEERGVFRYYEYFDLSDEAVFSEYVQQVKAAALYDTGITAEYGDELLALSTCNYHTADGRFVVVAKRIS